MEDVIPVSIPVGNAKGNNPYWEIARRISQAQPRPSPSHGWLLVSGYGGVTSHVGSWTSRCATLLLPGAALDRGTHPVPLPTLAKAAVKIRQAAGRGRDGGLRSSVVGL